MHLTLLMFPTQLLRYQETIIDFDIYADIELYAEVYSVTPKLDRWIFVNNEKVNKKYQFLMVRFIKVIHPPRYGEIYGF